MKFKNLFTDEDAVSPVIGVILMVAITVILAAVIGAFVLGIGGSQEQVPQASWSFDTSTDSPTYVWVQVDHRGGDEINTDRLTVSIGGTDVWEAGSMASGAGGWSADTGNTTGFSGTATAGNTLSVRDDDGGISDGASITVVWSASGSDQTNIIGEGEVNK